MPGRFEKLSPRAGSFSRVRQGSTANDQLRDELKYLYDAFRSEAAVAVFWQATVTTRANPAKRYQVIAMEGETIDITPPSQQPTPVRLTRCN